MSMSMSMSEMTRRVFVSPFMRMPDRGNLPKVFRRAGAHVTGSVAATIGDSGSLGLACRIPTAHASTVEQFMTEVYGAAAFTPAPKARGLKLSLIILADDSRGLMSRVTNGVTKAGASISRLDGRPLVGGDTRQYAIEAEIVAPPAVTADDVVAGIKRFTPNDTFRITDGTTGRTRGSRVAVKPGPLSEPAPAGANVRFVFDASGPDEDGLVANATALLAVSGASVERAVGFSVNGCYSLLLQAVGSAEAYESVAAARRDQLKGYHPHLTGCHYPGIATAGHMFYRFQLTEQDDLDGVCPLWKVRTAADAAGVSLAQLNAYPYLGEWFGTDWFRVEATVFGPAAAMARFASVADEWEREGSVVTFAPAADAVPAHEGELYLPLKSIVAHDRDTWVDAFRSE